MSLYVLDTDTVSHLRARHPVVVSRAAAVPVTDVCVAVITVEEQLDGWYTLLRRPLSRPRLADAYCRLAETVPYYSSARIHRSPKRRWMSSTACTSTS